MPPAGVVRMSEGLMMRSVVGSRGLDDQIIAVRQQIARVNAEIAAASQVSVSAVRHRSVLEARLAVLRAKRQARGRSL